eukprot:Protomagalhaensia_sp_Gyna_25__1520@NODE_1780_length_1541_cov_499_292943_g1459_i0_p1_GENE_NODE_1780_length_1541_cov_499_292943_g1459_i0NODE_1780_length_1541_cov_499_292943_g1459_i0_p1_ORF_typecomplete_len224_score16_14_NODE_1780_length_1541_cov_499_292943_g1459_i0157828
MLSKFLGTLLIISRVAQSQDYQVTEWNIINATPGGTCPSICTRPTFSEMVSCFEQAQEDCHGTATMTVYAPWEWDDTCSWVTTGSSLFGFVNLLPGLYARGFDVDFYGSIWLSFSTDMAGSCAFTLHGSTYNHDQLEQLPPTGMCSLADINAPGVPLPAVRDHLGRSSNIMLLDVENIATLGNTPYVYVFEPTNADCGQSLTSVSWRVTAQFAWHGLLPATPA